MPYLSLKFFAAIIFYYLAISGKNKKRYISIIEYYIKYG
jgi:hypothetical protein